MSFFGRKGNLFLHKSTNCENDFISHKSYKIYLRGFHSVKFAINLHSGLFGGVIISVKSNTEMILYGGATNMTVRSDVWKFHSQTQSWSKFGSMLNKRKGFAGMVAPYLECP